MMKATALQHKQIPQGLRASACLLSIVAAGSEFSINSTPTMYRWNSEDSKGLFKM